MAKQNKQADSAEAAKPKEKAKKPTPKLKKPNKPKSNNPIGRPKLPLEVRESVLKFLREGNSKRDSCLGAGISVGTLCDWQAKAADFKEKGIENEYTQFIEQIEQAQAEARRYALNCWKNLLPNDWRASVTYLERTDPENWAPKQKIDVTSNGQTVGPMIVPLKEENS